MVTVIRQRSPPGGQMGLNFKSRRDIDALVRQNVRLAKRSADERLVPAALCKLRNLTVNFGFSIALGDLLWLDGKWYVTHSGLLRLAQHRHCAGIKVHQVRS